MSRLTYTKVAGLAKQAAPDNVEEYLSLLGINKGTRNPNGTPKVINGTPRFSDLIHAPAGNAQPPAAAPRPAPIVPMSGDALGSKQDSFIGGEISKQHGGTDFMRLQRGRQGATPYPFYRDEQGYKHVLYKGKNDELGNAVMSRLSDLRNQEGKVMRRERMNPSARVFSVEDTKNKPEYRRRIPGTNIGIWGTVDPNRAGAAYEDIMAGKSGKYSKNTIFGMQLPFGLYNPFSRDQSKIDAENARRKNERWARIVNSVKGQQNATRATAANDDLITSVYNTAVTPTSHFESRPGGPVEVVTRKGPSKTLYNEYGIPIMTQDRKWSGNLNAGEVANLKENIIDNTIARLGNDAIGAAYLPGSKDFNNMRNILRDIRTQGRGYSDIINSRGFRMLLDNVRNHIMANPYVDKSTVDERVNLAAHALLQSISGGLENHI